MLTGELPLGRFAPPSRKAQIDVRLDEVVLHTLEKEPERRYQHASQVKTDVETIAGTAQPQGIVLSKAPKSETVAEQQARRIRLERMLALPLGIMGLLDCLITWMAGKNLVRSAAFGIFCLGLALVMFVRSRRGWQRLSRAEAVPILVFGLTFFAAAAVIFLLPESFCSTARVRLTRGGPNAPLWLDARFIETELAVLQSQRVLYPVIERLELDERWGARQRTGGKLWRYEALALLKERLDVRSIRSSSLFDIRVLSEEPNEAAEIANAIAESYRSAQTTNHVRIVDSAVPGLQTVFSRKLQNLEGGAALGLMLGFLAGGLTLWLGKVRQYYHPWRARIGMSLVVLTVLVLLGIGIHSWLGTRNQPDLTVTGLVTDVATGQPIAGARVADNRYGTDADRAPQESWTDANGRYELRTWYEEHTVAASAPGYETKLATLLTKPFGHEREVRMDFQLQPEPEPGQSVDSLPPVVVQTEPASGARDVAPGIVEIRVKFSKEMADG
ncbi:MAG: carboxypeptidase regulatory-like domain-containing protein, partial [Verrucomicrobiota bacterium]